MEENTPHRRAVLRFYLLCDVPRDCLALAIRIGREKDLAGITRGALQLSDSLFFSGDRHVFRLEAVLDVDSHLLLGQIADVTDRRAHAVRAPEVLPDRLCLRRRLDDHERCRARLRRSVVLGDPGRALSGASRFGGARRAYDFCCALSRCCLLSCLGFRYL